MLDHDDQQTQELHGAQKRVGQYKQEVHEAMDQIDEQRDEWDQQQASFARMIKKKRIEAHDGEVTLANYQFKEFDLHSKGSSRQQHQKSHDLHHE